MRLTSVLTACSGNTLKECSPKKGGGGDNKNNTTDNGFNEILILFSRFNNLGVKGCYSMKHADGRKQQENEVLGA